MQGYLTWWYTLSDMWCELAAISQTGSSPFPFWWETFSIFLGDVLASIFVGGGAYLLWYILNYPGFRVGANWSYTGWDIQKMGRFPSESDSGKLQLMPNVAVTSRDMTVKKIISAVWVRERADLRDPGHIHGRLDLKQTGIPVEVRTTGGDLLNLPGPSIMCDASQFQKITNCPVFVQTSDGEFYQAMSPGNQPKGIVRLRYKTQDFVSYAKQWLLQKLS
jgi:hypothetical protein